MWLNLDLLSPAHSPGNTELDCRNDDHTLSVIVLRQEGLSVTAAVMNRSADTAIAKLRPFLKDSQPHDREMSSSGTPLCQGTAWRIVLDWVVGPGRGFSEEPMSGVRSVTLDQ